MIIKNGSVFGEDGVFTIKDIYIENHTIVSSKEELTDTAVVDATGLQVLPGLIDIHSHGAVGHDFSDADTEGLYEILKYQKNHGITSYCPTSITLPKARLYEIFSKAAKAASFTDGARIAGINMEGPFIGAGKKGAHDERYIIPPDVDFFRECNAACNGLIRLVTLAPEATGANEFMDELRDEVVISMGHTGADYETAKAAFKRGVRHVTHLYNAMRPFSHREPAVPGAAADDESCMVELISDGIHVHPSAVRATFRLFGTDRVVLISDSMMAAGMADGVYELGGQKVIMKNQKAILESGTIAGSAINLFDCMKRAISFGVSKEQAIWAATRNPARSIGIYEKTGSITPGKEADLILVDKQWQLVQVY